MSIIDLWILTREMSVNKETDNSGTVGKAMEILDLVASFDRPVRFTELQEISPHPKATLYRFVQTLTNQNMLAHSPETGCYSLGARLVRLAHTAWQNASLAPIARHDIEMLSVAVQETVHLAQIDNANVIFVDKVQANQNIQTLAQAGMTAPAYCTGVGKAMLAFMSPKRLEIVLQQQSYYGFTPNTHTSAESVLQELDTIRAQGVAFDREEHENGIISIAAPILMDSGRVIGAVSVATATSRTTLAGLSSYKDQLIQTAERIGAAASTWQFPS